MVRKAAKKTTGRKSNKESAKGNSKKIKKTTTRTNKKKPNALSELTCNFIALLNEADNEMADVNEAKDQLDVQKRRIYDITNVLEGIGYIQKMTKNKVKLIDQNNEKDLDEQLNNLHKELDVLTKNDKECDEKIEKLEKELELIGNDEETKQFAYVSESDVKFLLNYNKLKAPYMIIEAPEKAKIDYYTPKERIDERKEEDFDKEKKTDALKEYQIVIENESDFGVYVASNKE